MVECVDQCFLTVYCHVAAIQIFYVTVPYTNFDVSDEG